MMSSMQGSNLMNLSMPTGNEKWSIASVHHGLTDEMFEY